MPPTRWLVVLPLVTACTSLNPAYEEPAEGIATEEATSDPLGTEGDTIAQGADTTGAEAEAEGTGESSSGDETPPAQELCLADLYGIDEDGQLHLLDLDAHTVVSLPMMEELGSWAMATHPETGVLHISEHGAPTTLWRVSPVTFMRDPTPLSVPGTNTIDLARAAFTPEGVLWLGTDDTNLFISFLPGDAQGDERTKEGPGRGGDLLFLGPELALVTSLDGAVWLVRFDSLDAPTPFAITLKEVSGVPPFTGLARDRDGQPWLATIDGLLVRLDIEGLPDVPPTPVETIDFAIAITDLAPIVELPGGC